MGVFAQIWGSKKCRLPKTNGFNIDKGMIIGVRSIDKNTLVPTCGDRQIVGTEQCDDGNEAVVENSYR